MSELVKCATCKTEKPLSEMKTCMQADREYSVCDMPCMIKFYKGEIKPDTVVTPDLEEMGKLGMNPKEYHLHKENLELRTQLAKANDYTAELEVRKEALEESLNGCTEKVLSLSGKLAKANERVAELEGAILDSCSTYHFEPDISQPVDSLKELLRINSKWTLNPEISSDAARFAVEKKADEFEKYASMCEAFRTVPSIEGILHYAEQLRKEQDSE